MTSENKVSLGIWFCRGCGNCEVRVMTGEDRGCQVCGEPAESFLRLTDDR